MPRKSKNNYTIEDIDNVEKPEDRETVKNYIEELDQYQKKLKESTAKLKDSNDYLKMLRKKIKELKNSISRFMVHEKVEKVELPSLGGGAVVIKPSYTTPKMDDEYILMRLYEYFNDQEKAEDLFKFLIEERPVNQTNNIVLMDKEEVDKKNERERKRLETAEKKRQAQLKKLAKEQEKDRIASLTVDNLKTLNGK